MEITILHKQSLLDIAIQHTGNATNAYAIARANGLGVSDLLEPGAVLIIPDDIEKDMDIVNYYSAKGIQPATSITTGGEAEEQLEGISYWIINQDFIVQ
ncbi:hypothetical protein [Chryseobacterium sp. T1]